MVTVDWLCNSVFSADAPPLPNPVWDRNTFGAPRYMYEVLDSAAPRRAFRIGRRMGKTCTMLAAVYEALMRGEERIMVISPNQQQSELFFDRLLASLEHLNLDEHGVVLGRKKRTQPWKLQATFRGRLLDGTVTGYGNAQGNCWGITGQEAGLIVLDEADYIHPGVYSSFLYPALATRPGTKVLAGGGQIEDGKPFDTFCNRQDVALFRFNTQGELIV